jgi:ketosteroid isomerase-like protein
MVARDELLQTLEALVDAFNAHDLDRIMNFFAPDCVLEMPRGPDPWGTRFEGLAAVREGLRGRFTGTPDVRYGEATHNVDGNTGFSRWTLTGTTPAGGRLEVHGCDFYTFRDGKIVRKDSYWKIRQ